MTMSLLLSMMWVGIGAATAATAVAFIRTILNSRAHHVTDQGRLDQRMEFLAQKSAELLEKQRTEQKLAAATRELEKAAAPRTWCQGCDDHQVLESDMGFTEIGLYRCDACRAVPMAS